MSLFFIGFGTAWAVQLVLAGFWLFPMYWRVRKRDRLRRSKLPNYRDPGRSK